MSPFISQSIIVIMAEFIPQALMVFWEHRL